MKKIKNIKTGIQHGYRSGLERKIAAQLTQLRVPVLFETLKIDYIIPQSPHRYTPDFILPNGIIIETKGQFKIADRKKHILIKQQHPELDIRFVFSNARAKLYKGSKTTYAQWCIKNHFTYAHRYIPEAWIYEKPKI